MSTPPLREAFADFVELARIQPAGRELTVLKAAFMTGLRVGMSIAGMQPEDAAATMRRWADEANDFYREGHPDAR